VTRRVRVPLPGNEKFVSSITFVQFNAIIKIMFMEIISIVRILKTLSNDDGTQTIFVLIRTMASLCPVLCAQCSQQTPLSEIEMKGKQQWFAFLL